MRRHIKLLQQPACLFICTLLIFSTVSAKAPARYYYQLKIYHLRTTTQEERVDKYLQAAYLPALRRAGIKSVGVFKPVDKDSLLHIYVFIPCRSLQQLTGIEQQLQKDKQYLADGSDYLNAVYNEAPYERIETTLLQAFEGMPEPAVLQLTGPKEKRVFELRSYEGPTEKYYTNKVQMFNKGEVDLFKKLGFNAVFYAEVVTGSRMPNLMYMTSFDNKESREAHWKTFSADPTWKTMSALPEYQHNVSKINIIFLYPVEYSDY